MYLKCIITRNVLYQGTASMANEKGKSSEICFRHALLETLQIFLSVK